MRFIRKIIREQLPTIKFPTVEVEGMDHHGWCSQKKIEKHTLMNHQELLALKKTNKLAHRDFLFSDQKIVYVGETENLTQRINTHTSTWGGYKSFDSFVGIPAPLNELERLELEQRYIKKFNPKHNKKHREKTPDGCFKETTNQTFTNNQEP
jgi:hypothetical protein